MAVIYGQDPAEFLRGATTHGTSAALRGLHRLILPRSEAELVPQDACTLPLLVATSNPVAAIVRGLARLALAPVLALVTVPVELRDRLRLTTVSASLLALGGWFDLGFPLPCWEVVLLSCARLAVGPATVWALLVLRERFKRETFPADRADLVCADRNLGRPL